MNGSAKPSSRILTRVPVIEGTEGLKGYEVERAYVGRGYRCHETANPRPLLTAGVIRSFDDGTVPREGTCFNETIPCYDPKNSLFH